MPVLSIIIPVYNVENYLKKCIDSVINQTLTDYELLLVDDGSTDSSGKICDQYAYSDIRIQVFHIKNKGPANARNFGLDRARGDYIGFLDSDDWIDPDMYQTLCGHARETLSDLVFCDYVAETSKGKQLEISYQDVKPPFERKEIETKFLPYFFGYANDELQDFKKYCPFADYHSYNVLGVFKREIIEKNDIRFKDQSKIMNEDNLLNLDFIMSARRISHIHKYFYHYRYNDGSISQSFNKRYLEMKLNKYEYLKNYIERHHLSPDYYGRLQNKMGIETVSIVNYYAGSRKLSLQEKYEYVRKIAKNPLLWDAIQFVPIKRLSYSKVKCYLILLRMKACHLIVLLSSVYRLLF